MAVASDHTRTSVSESAESTIASPSPSIQGTRSHIFGSIDNPQLDQEENNHNGWQRPGRRKLQANDLPDDDSESILPFTSSLSKSRFVTYIYKPTPDPNMTFFHTIEGLNYEYPNLLCKLIPGGAMCLDASEVNRDDLRNRNPPSPTQLPSVNSPSPTQLPSVNSPSPSPSQSPSPTTSFESERIVVESTERTTIAGIPSTTRPPPSRPPIPGLPDPYIHEPPNGSEKNTFAKEPNKDELHRIGAGGCVAAAIGGICVLVILGGFFFASVRNYNFRASGTKARAGLFTLQSSVFHVGQSAVSQSADLMDRSVATAKSGDGDECIGPSGLERDHVHSAGQHSTGCDDTISFKSSSTVSLSRYLE